MTEVMTNPKPLIIAVAPNGARCSKEDHAAVPISPSELATTAYECMEAGAQMIHLHVRDENSLHSLAPKHYLPALKAVKEAVGEEMLIQVTSEAAGVYKPEQQIDLMLQLKADFISIALREFVAIGESPLAFSNFIKQLTDNNTLLQFILYDENDFKHYQQLVESNVIHEANHSLLFVLGRYTSGPPSVDIVKQYESILTTDNPWMVCTFGTDAPQILTKTVALNCHARVGFENGFYLPDGSIAESNADIVRQSRQLFTSSGRTLATINETRKLLGH